MRSLNINQGEDTSAKEMPVPSVLKQNQPTKTYLFLSQLRAFLLATYHWGLLGT